MWLRCLATAVCLATTSVPAYAAAPAAEDRVLVLPIQLEGELTEDERSRLESALREGFGRAALAAIEDARVEPHLPRTGYCSDDRCVRKLMQELGATVAVRTRVSVHDRVYTFELQVLSGSELSSRARAHDTCEICGLEEVAELLSDQAAVVGEKAQEVASQPRLRVESKPAGARVVLDDALVGTTPLELEVSPGPHTVRLEREGFLGQDRRFDAQAGVEEHVDVHLQAVPNEPNRERKRKIMLGAGGAAIGLGLGLVATGVPLVVLDGRQNTRKCTGDDIDVNGTCRWTYRTMAGGITGLAVGAAFTVAGAVLVGLGARAGAASNEGRVAFRPTSNGLQMRF